MKQCYNSVNMLPGPEKMVFVDAKPTNRIDSLGALPFGSELVDRIPMVINPDAPEELDEQDKFKLIRPTIKHGRAFDMRFGEQDNCDPQIVFGDEHGNFFTSLGTKGNDCSNVVACHSELEPSSLQIKGMQDASLVRRVVMLSERLRAGGVDTEWIVASRRPSQFPRVMPDMQTLALESLQSLRESVQLDTEEASSSPDHPELLENLSNLDSLRFAVTFRALKTPYRLGDIGMAADEAMAFAIMHGVITAHNLEEEIKARRDSNYTPVIIEKTPEGYHKYIIEVLPRIIGQNVARMHNLGVRHEYLHPGNISLLGGLYDLDSVDCHDVFPDDVRLTTGLAVRDLADFVTLRKVNGMPRWFVNVVEALFQESESYNRIVPGSDLEDFRTFVVSLIDSYLAERDFGDRLTLEVPFRAAQAEIVPMDDELLSRYLPDSYIAKTNEIFESEFACHMKPAKVGEALGSFMLRGVEINVSADTPPVTISETLASLTDLIILPSELKEASEAE